MRQSLFIVALSYGEIDCDQELVFEVVWFGMLEGLEDKQSFSNEGGIVLEDSGKTYFLFGLVVCNVSCSKCDGSGYGIIGDEKGYISGNSHLIVTCYHCVDIVFL